MVPVIGSETSRLVAGLLTIALLGVFIGWLSRERAAQASVHRLQERIEHYVRTADHMAERAREWQRNAETLRNNVATLESYIAEQNAAMERLGAAYAKAEDRRRAAEARLREYMARPIDQVTVAPGTCEEMVEQARRIGGGT